MRSSLVQPIVSLLVFVAMSPLPAHAEDVSDYDFFEKKIRPVLVEHCYECHSVDSKKIRGGFVSVSYTHLTLPTIYSV